jgi:Na+/proline symporter
MHLRIDGLLATGGLQSLDHLVIGAFLAGLLAMGFSIARRQKSTDDFFVGGRNLPSWAVGISLIASLLSTITYLGMPGEMFRTGLGFLTRQLGLPIVLLIVWFLWIPFFMRLGLTSAYEYLERRFNYATRAIAAVFCLFLLFGWISVVVLTASKAMAEIADLRLDNVSWLGKNIPATRTQSDGTARIGPEDLTDSWPRLIAEIPAQVASDAAAPGKQVWQCLPPSVRDDWQSLVDSGRQTEDDRQWIADQLTAVLSRRDLYDGRAWESVHLVESAGSYLKAGVDQLSDREVSYMNRALLVSAFPAEIEASRPGYRDADMHALIITIGLFSVLYTTLGGIRAVVWTDVIQFFILIAGALVTMAVIGWETNSGLGDWLQTVREYKHEQVEWFSWDIGTRSTVFSISIGMLFWHMCTHGANQVALQRYFTVKDVWAARRSFLVNAVASIGLGIILAGVGISLMHFIQHHEAMGIEAVEGIDSAVESIRNESQDKIFPQFIHSSYFPVGLRGLVVAALFAAAMSTIDSGANSVSTIVTVDFFRRLFPGGSAYLSELKLARILTASMGIVVVLSTVGLYHLSKGTDLITLCQKGFNCFLGPLGALFVLAMFSSRVTARSVIPAVLIGELVGIGASYSVELSTAFAAYMGGSLEVFGRTITLKTIPFSTHLVVPAAWLATIVVAYVLALVQRTRVSEDQRQWMWRPVVRGSREMS